MRAQSLIATKREDDSRMLRPISFAWPFLFALLCSAFSFQSVPSARPLPVRDSAELIKIAEGVYADIVSPDGNAVGNSGIVVLDRGVLVFDTHFTPEAGQALAGKIRALTSKPIQHVVYSHFHPDHTHGTQSLQGTPQIIGSTISRSEILQKDVAALNRSVAAAQTQLEKMRKALDEEADPIAKRRLRTQINTRQEFFDRMSRQSVLAPIVTVDDSLLLVDGKRQIQIRYLGKGHTDGDLILYLPAEKIVFLGDLFFNAALPNVQDATLLVWIKTLEEALKLDAEKFVPGHGAVGSREDVKAFIKYLEELRGWIEPAVARGDGLDQVIHEVQLPGKYSSYGFQNFFPSNVQKMYEELKTQQLEAEAAQAEAEKKLKKPNPRR
jgi:cyclase